MNSCLWVQWKKPTDSSRFVIDGVPSEYSRTDVQDGVMSLLINAPKFKEIAKKRKGDDLSPSFRLSYVSAKGKTYFCVEGNFEEKDEADRKLVYIFLTQEKDSQSIVDILQEYSKKLGVTPHQQDLEVIKSHQFNKYNNTKIVLCVTVAITVISLLVLFTLLNHQNK